MEMANFMQETNLVKMVDTIEILEKEKVERVEFDDRLNPILVAQDEVKGIFNEMMCLGLEEKDIVNSKIPISTTMKFEKMSYLN
jgi:hypothetical protein